MACKIWCVKKVLKRWLERGRRSGKKALGERENGSLLAVGLSLSWGASTG